VADYLRIEEPMSGAGVDFSAPLEAE
jgi:hypothetical protein